jgi:hypothetical protein
MTTAGYEFSAEENAVFQRLVKNMSRAGVVAVLASLVLLAYHIVDYLGVSAGTAGSVAVTYLDYAAWGVISLIGIFIGVALVRATAAFTAVIRTQGNDVAHLMSGLGRLADIFGTIVWAAVLALILLVVSFALLLIYV